MLQIAAPERFHHAGNLASPAAKDPRDLGFAETYVDMDLRRCEFVYPAAVLWCLVYGLLVRTRGVACRLLVPENLGVAVHLKSLGLFALLQDAEIDVDDRGLHATPNNQVILPLTGFRTQAEAENLANQALERLNTTGRGAANLRTVVSETFGELASNAVQHAESEIGGFGLIQFFEAGQRFSCVVADGGIGIRRSMEHNPALRPLVPYDWIAIDRAVRERVSGTGEPTRGIGLFGVAEDMRQGGRNLIIHSGIGMLTINERVESRAERTRLFPGTLVSATIPT